MVGYPSNAIRLYKKEDEIIPVQTVSDLYAKIMSEKMRIKAHK